MTGPVGKEPTPDTVVYRSFAKINLYLDVLDRRPDGFHSIETIYQTVDLWDALRFTRRPAEVTLKSNSDALGPAESNLAYRAAALMKERFDVAQGVHIEVRKRIPIAAGLAGGSGNAAAALIALNALWDLKLRPPKVRELALELGSDVPYCTVGGTMVGTGRGERLRALKPLPKTWFVLVHPRIAVSTAEVFQHPDLPKSGPANDEMSARLQTAMERLEKGRMASVLFNAFEGVVFKMHPDLRDMKRRVLGTGCDGALMSGSGPTLFGVCRSEAEAHAFAEDLPGLEASIVSSVPHGVVRVK